MSQKLCRPMKVQWPASYQNSDMPAPTPKGTKTSTIIATAAGAR